MRFLIFFLLTNFAFSQSMIEQDMKQLCSEAFAGRFSGTNGDRLTQDYIVSRMKAKGYKVKKQKVSFVHQGKTIKTYNIVWQKKGLTKEQIVLGAHYDHLGTSGEKSFEIFDKNKLHVGADDNASGVALLLAIADTMAQVETTKAIVFVAFGGHELGLYGSQAFVANKKNIKDVELMINFEMVGRLNDNFKRLVINTTNRKLLENDFWQSNQTFDLRFEKENVLLLDHLAFYQKSIPCMSITTGSHNDYHKTTDSLNKINFFGIYQISNWLIDFFN